MKSRNKRSSGPRLAAAAVAAGLIGMLPAAHALERTEVRQQDLLKFVTGGIGRLDQQRTRELGKDMNLQLVFAQADGTYLADVGVTLKGQDGKKVLDLNSADPMLFAELPPGRYQVTATVDGHAIQRSVAVPEHGQRVEYFHWPTR
jgi:hypothetical protein